MFMFDRIAASMAKTRKKGHHGQRQSTKPSASRSKHWSGVNSIPLPSSQSALTTNTRQVFGEGNDNEPSPLLTGRSGENAWGANRNKGSHTLTGSSVKRTTDSDFIRKTHDKSLDDESSIYDSTNEDINGAKLLKGGINDVVQQKGRKTAQNSVNCASKNESQDNNSGKETDSASESEKQRETSPQSHEATDQGTPSPSQLTKSSLQKLNQAEAAALELKKFTKLPVSATQNVLHAHSPIESSIKRKTQCSDTDTSSNAGQIPSYTALTSSSSTALVQATENLGSWRASQNITMPSSPLPQSSSKKMKGKSSEPGSVTVIEAPKTYGAPPSPPSRRASSTQKAQRDAEARIPDVWGKKFASQGLVIEPFQTFSSKASAFDVDSSSDDEYLDKVKNGNLIKSDKKKKGETADSEKKTEPRKTKQKPEQGWDAVLAEARFQAERLQKRKIEMDRLRDIDDTVAREKKRKAGKAGKKKGQKNIKDASILPPAGADNVEKDKKEDRSKTSKKRKHSEVDAADDLLETPRKQRKTDKESKKDKKRKHAKDNAELSGKRHSKEKHQSNEVDSNGIGKPEELLGDHKKNKVTEEKSTINNSNNKTPILTDLHDLIPRAVLSSAARSLNDAEVLRSATKVAKMQRKEQRKIKKGRIRPIDAIWQGLDVESAQNNNLIDEAKVFEETHDVVVIRAAVNLIRALSQSAVIAGMRKVADGDSSQT